MCLFNSLTSNVDLLDLILNICKSVDTYQSNDAVRLEIIIESCKLRAYIISLTNGSAFLIVYDGKAKRADAYPPLKKARVNVAFACNKWKQAELLITRDKGEDANPA